MQVLLLKRWKKDGNHVWTGQKLLQEGYSERQISEKLQFWCCYAFMRWCFFELSSIHT